MRHNKPTKRHIFLAGAAVMLMAALPAHGQQTLTFDEALNIAMENSPNIKTRRLDLERSREMLNAQRAALKSQFSLSLNPLELSRDRQFNSTFSEWVTTESTQSSGRFMISQPIAQTDGTISLINNFSWQNSFSDFRDVRNKSFTNNLYLNFSQPLFTYNRTQLATRELELDLESTTLNFAIQKLNLEVQVARAFYTVYQNQLSLEIAEDEYANQEESHNIISNKVDAGLAALEELYQAELNLATSESSLEDARVTLENSLDSFKALLNIPLDQEVSIEVETEFEPVSVNLETAVNSGLERRMELRQNEINLVTAQNSLIETKARNEFNGNITLSFGLIGNDEDVGDMFRSPTNSQTVGLSFDIPLWDWGESDARVKATEATIERQKVTNEDERVNIRLEIRESYRSLQNQIRQLEIEEQNVRNAQLTYDINLERYRNGDLTSMDLSLYQNQLSSRRMGLVRARINYYLALLDLKVKSLWNFETNEPVVPDIEI